MTKTTESGVSQSSRLLTIINGYEQVRIVMHDNPDPDAIASAWGLEMLISEQLRKPVRVVGGGAIVRAENRHMVELLNPPIELVDLIEVDPATATILVDCGVEATNHLLTQHQIQPTCIVDHHLSGESVNLDVPFCDVRTDVAASATIVASYLKEQSVQPGQKLATAMLYAIKTETCGYETHFSELDRQILPWLTEQGDPACLAEIENAPLSKEYFGDLLLALQGTFLYGDVGFCFLPQAAGVEIVGEVADLLVRCEGIKRVLCAALVSGDLFLSARTQHNSGNAVTLLLTTLKGIGGAGGHRHRAGGKVLHAGHKKTDDLYAKLRKRWLDACGCEQRRGQRLIAKWQIVENLQN